MLGYYQLRIIIHVEIIYFAFYSTYQVKGSTELIQD